MWLLDTNTCIVYLKGRNTALRERVDAASPDEVALCSVVKGELLAGAMKRPEPTRRLADLERFFAQPASFPMDDTAAYEYGRIRAYLELRGTPIGSYDMMIAAIALANDLTVVTHNTDEFSRVPGLTVEDWQA